MFTFVKPPDNAAVGWDVGTHGGRRKKNHISGCFLFPNKSKTSLLSAGSQCSTFSTSFCPRQSLKGSQPCCPLPSQRAGLHLGRQHLPQELICWWSHQKTRSLLSSGFLSFTTNTNHPCDTQEDRGVGRNKGQK